MELARDTRIVIDKCTNRDGKSAPPAAIQATLSSSPRFVSVR
jgi:hypothetical protein